MERKPRKILFKSRTRGKSVSSSEMQSIDKIAQERFNIKSITLMENAGTAAAACAINMLRSQKNNKKKKLVAVFCGKGNNGGDGLVVTRKLLENNIDASTYLLCGEDELKKDPAVNLRILKKLGANITILKKETRLDNRNYLDGCDLVIDSIFGTGFKGKPDKFLSWIIDFINKSGVDVLSIDVPSGLDATTGLAQGACVKASQTIALGLPKTGFYESNGPEYTGEVVVKNIGFPDTLLRAKGGDRSKK